MAVLLIIYVHIYEQKKPTNFFRILLTIFEFVCYITVAAASIFVERCKWDFAAVILLAAAVTVSFSGLSYSNKLFSAPIFAYLGKFSLSLYLNHILWFKVLRESNLNLTLTQELLISLSLIITSSLVCMFFTDTLSILWKNNKHKVKALFLREKTIQ